jgi:PAS domain S-box-containing protein
MPDGKPARSETAERTALIAGLGVHALGDGALDELLGEACQRAAAGVAVKRAKVLEYRAATDDLLIVAGVGWHPGVVGRLGLGSSMASPPGHAFRTGAAVAIADLRQQTDYEHSAVLREHGVVSLLNVPIRVDHFTWGVLEVDAEDPRQWGAEETDFLLALAHLLAAALRRRAAEAEARRERAERDRLFTALRASEQRYRALFEQAAVGIERITRDGRLIEVNERLCDMLGYTALELAGRSFAELTHEEDLARELPLVERLLTGELRSYTIEKRYLRKSGEPLWIRVSSSLAEPDQGEPYRVSVIADISQRKRAEAALAENERLLSATFENASVGIAETAPDGRYLRVNPKLSEMTGYSREELLGLRFTDLTHPEDRAADLARYDLQLQRQLDSYILEKRCLRKDGSLFWAHVAASMMRDDGGRPLIGIRILQDVTERKHAEDELRRLNETLEQRVAAEIAVRREAEEALHQAQKMEAVGQLTGGIAHDFNNLLTVVSGNLELLRGRTEVPRQLRMIDAAMHATERGERLTSQLLAFSRRQQLRPESVDVNALIRGFETLLRRAVGETMRIEMKLAAALWTARLDPAQLESALLNLVVNARDATPGGGRIEIETRNVESDPRLVARVADATPGPWIVVGVCDSGSGMPAHVAERAFEPFFTTKDVGRGSGLGLSQVYGFVRQSGGHVTIDSTPGEGTIIRLYLPRAPGTPAPAGGRREGGDGVPSGAGIVLVVEDDPDVLALAVTLLRELGYTVLTAADGPDALEVLGRESIDLIFSDVVMPRRMSGIDLAREAIRRHPRLKVLLTSGYADTAEPADLPGVAFVRKPYRRRDLAAELKRLLDGR